MDILNLLDQIEDIIEEASKIPLSNKIMLDKEEILGAISDIRIKLPEEINRASWVAKERQRILLEAQAEADEQLNKAKEQQHLLIEEHEITKYAKQTASQIMQDAEKKAHEMKQGAYSYSDEILLKLQEKIRDMGNIIQENRDVLKKM